MIFEGFLDSSIFGYVLYTLAVTHITIISVTLYLHRNQTHRALNLHPVISHFFRFWLWLTTGMVTKEWVAVHRKHHAKCETEEDPHSPQTRGIKKLLLEGAELYKNESKIQKTLDTYGVGTPDDWVERHIYSSRRNLGFTLMLIINVFMFGPIGLTIWAIQMLWIPVWAAGVINGIGHWWGYRNYETSDASRNISPIGILIGGEEFHNNHHTYANSAKFSTRWWEFDIGWMYIRLLVLFGLAKVNKLAPKPVMGPIKSIVDLETVNVLAANRFQIMSKYCSSVIFPVFKDELRRADESCRRTLKRAKCVLIREESLLDDDAKNRLKLAFSRSEQLEIVYSYKQRLQTIWKRSADTQESLLQHLQEWCKQAEETGIKSLQDFAESLRRYKLQPA
ncbi:MAG: acyl-CoA desaturase [Gammaproteobacteria bacterium]|nr:acyl-CoA desaturase [Gammaproteobacteria bacterium]